MRPATYSAPGLGGEMNGEIKRILRSWGRSQKRDAKERSDSLAANKRKQEREERLRSEKKKESQPSK